MEHFEYRLKEGDALYNDLMTLTGADLHLLVTDVRGYFDQSDTPERFKELNRLSDDLTRKLAHDIHDMTASGGEQALVLAIAAESMMATFLATLEHLELRFEIMEMEGGNDDR